MGNGEAAVSGAVGCMKAAGGATNVVETLGAIPGTGGGSGYH